MNLDLNDRNFTIGRSKYFVKQSNLHLLSRVLIEPATSRQAAKLPMI